MSAQARFAFDPFAAIVHWREDGRALPIPATPSVFRKLVTGDRDRGDLFITPARRTRHRPVDAASGDD